MSRKTSWNRLWVVLNAVLISTNASMIVTTQTYHWSITLISFFTHLQKWQCYSSDWSTWCVKDTKCRNEAFLLRRDCNWLASFILRLPNNFSWIFNFQNHWFAFTYIYVILLLGLNNFSLCTTPLLQWPRHSRQLGNRAVLLMIF